MAEDSGTKWWICCSVKFRWKCVFYFYFKNEETFWPTQYMAALGEGSGNPLQYSCLESPTDRGAWWAAVHGAVKSRSWLSDFPFTFHFHALEKAMATHSNVLAWRIPGTGEPGGLPSMGSHRVGHNWNDLAAAAAAGCIYIFSIRQSYLLSQAEHRLISFKNVLLSFWGHTRTHWIKI